MVTYREMGMKLLKRRKKTKLMGLCNHDVQRGQRKVREREEEKERKLVQGDMVKKRTTTESKKIKTHHVTYKYSTQMGRIEESFPTYGVAEMF